MPQADDQEVFRAAVHALATVLDVPVLIDPRPMSIHVVMRFPGEESYHAAERREVIERMDVIRSLGLDSTRIIPLRADCTPLLAPPSHKRTTGCPERLTSEVVLDRPRRDDDGNGSVVRALVVTYMSKGRSGTIYDLPIDRTRHGIAVRELRQLLVLD